MTLILSHLIDMHCYRIQKKVLTAALETTLLRSEISAATQDQTNNNDRRQERKKEGSDNWRFHGERN